MDHGYYSFPHVPEAQAPSLAPRLAVAVICGAVFLASHLVPWVAPTGSAHFASGPIARPPLTAAASSVPLGSRIAPRAVPFDPLGLSEELAPEEGQRLPPNALTGAVTAAGVLAAAQPSSAATLDVETAVSIRAIAAPVTSLLELLFLARIVLDWFPKVKRNPTEMPWGAVWMPTELVCAPVRKLVPNLNGIDLSPVLWFFFFSLSNELIWSRQGLLMVLTK
mmetsp:Transcript_80320/g.141655  ORF Transcript_80320/g.141655 Transcript_80320/m.141655 type:complete len:222 (-) Transcript_80320:122-787(-)